MYLGAHLGIADGLAVAVREARRIGCESLQIFSKSPQMWSGPALAVTSAEEFRSAVRSEPLRATAVHHGYLANLGSPKPEMLARSRQAFLDEIRRAELLAVDGLIFHPGAHLGSGSEAGVRTIVESLRGAIAEVPEGKVRLLLENAAGQGTTLGSTFEELAAVLDAVDAPDRVGVALDTCHLFAAGFDFRTEEGYGALIDRLEAGVGCRRVYAFHLNDAKAPPAPTSTGTRTSAAGRSGGTGSGTSSAIAGGPRCPGTSRPPSTTGGTPATRRTSSRYAPSRGRRSRRPGGRSRDERPVAPQRSNRTARLERRR